MLKIRIDFEDGELWLKGETAEQFLKELSRENPPRFIRVTGEYPKWINTNHIQIVTEYHDASD